MKNKILKMLAIGLALTSIVSCEDWKLLDEHPKKIDATTFMSNADEVQSVINSIYSQLERDAGFGRYLSILPEAMADYAYGRGNYNTSYETGLTTNGQTFVKDSWAVLYRAIRFSNEIMSQIGDADLSQTEYKHLTGETRYLRAFAYSFLVKYWGAVPSSTRAIWTTSTRAGPLLRLSGNTLWMRLIMQHRAFRRAPLPAVLPNIPH